MTENYAELLPKCARVSTATFERRHGQAWEAAVRIGLAAMLRSGQTPAATAGAPVARRAEFDGVSRVARAYAALVFCHISVRTTVRQTPDAPQIPKHPADVENSCAPRRHRIG